MTAARLALRVAPPQEISAVTQVPMFCPQMIGMTAEKRIIPEADMACRTPTDADED